MTFPADATVWDCGQYPVRIGAQAVTIQSDVNQAITDYIQWQRHIGRDINPSKLISMIMAAGAKRVVVTYPVYTVVASTKVPTLSSDPTITYGGLEND